MMMLDYSFRAILLMTGTDPIPAHRMNRSKSTLENNAFHFIPVIVRSVLIILLVIIIAHLRKSEKVI